MKLAVLAWAAVSLSFAQPSPTARFSTNLGDIDVILLPGAAPRTVENFLNYVNRGAYTNSFIHRSVPGFVIQGGGYRWQNASPNIVEIPQDPPVVNEFRVSNTRGTIAMAKLGSGPNTATNQWFFNLGNNSSNLDNQNGGFTVFGRIANAAGLSVIDAIAALPRYNAGEPFDNLPLTAYSPGTDLQQRHLVTINSITLLNRIQSAGAFGRYDFASPGSWIEIFGADFAPEPGRAWSTSDFTGGRAPTNLDGIRVTMNGVPAYVAYISPTQINVQIPADIPSGGAVSIVVSKNGTDDLPVQFAIRERAPGLLAPESFRVGTRRYVYAAHADGSIVANGQFAELPNSPAAPGETLVFYGIGFGPVTTGASTHAGEIVQGLAPVHTPIEFRFNDVPGVVSYAGLVPGLVGLYQFNVMLPQGLESGDASVSVTVDGTRVPQTLFLPIQRQ